MHNFHPLKSRFSILTKYYSVPILWHISYRIALHCIFGIVRMKSHKYRRRKEWWKWKIFSAYKSATRTFRWQTREKVYNKQMPFVPIDAIVFRAGKLMKTSNGMILHEVCKFFGVVVVAKPIWFAADAKRRLLVVIRIYIAQTLKKRDILKKHQQLQKLLLFFFHASFLSYRLHAVAQRYVFSKFHCPYLHWIDLMLFANPNICSIALHTHTYIYNIKSSSLTLLASSMTTTKKMKHFVFIAFISNAVPHFFSFGHTKIFVYSSLNTYMTICSVFS